MGEVRQLLESAQHFQRTGEWGQAEFFCREALQRAPGHATVLRVLAETLLGQNRVAEAVDALRRANHAKPDSPAVQHLLGKALTQAGDVPAAMACWETAVRLDPTLAQAHTDLGRALLHSGPPATALLHTQKVIDLLPDAAAAHSNHGTVLSVLERWDEAIASQQEAIRLQPDYAKAYSKMAYALKEVGLIKEAVAAYRRSLEIQPGNAQVHSDLLYTLHYDPDMTPDAIFAEHLSFGQRHAEPLRQHIRPHEMDRTLGRRLRVGYVSPDFRDHPVARFLEPILAHHDHRAFEVFCYSDVVGGDAVTARLRGYADVWRDTAGFSDERLAELVRADHIDILVDLVGHMAGSRLLMFARKPAPVQIAYIGYPDTTGVAAMDYRITDGWHDPPGETDHRHTEKLIRLPGCAWCWTPPVEGVRAAVSELPAVRNGYITFGCLNNFAKVNEGCLGAWARILRAVPGSRLVLRVPPGGARERVLASLLRWGLETGGEERAQVEFVGRLPRAEYLSRMAGLDLALDTFPYNGHTTTLDALWAGVPVVSLAGRTHVGRAGLSVLNACGLGEWVATSVEDYVALAGRMTRDVTCMAGQRKQLRECTAGGRRVGGEVWTRVVETAYASV